MKKSVEEDNNKSLLGSLKPPKVVLSINIDVYKTTCACRVVSVEILKHPKLHYEPPSNKIKFVFLI